jgi:hypothetical protein
MRKGIDLMNRKRITTTLMMFFMGAMLCACKPSDEKLAEAESARNILLEYREKTEEQYLDITEDTKRAELDELSAQVDEVTAVDFTKMRDKKIDEYLPTVTNLTQQYDEILKSLGIVYESEEAARVEAAKHLESQCYLVNKTGMNLTSVKLHDITQDTTSPNMLGDDVVLNDGYTLMGVILEIYADSKEWEVVVTDENGREYFLTCPSLLGENNDGMSLTLKYDTEKGEGLVETSSYVKEQETESADAAASDGSSAEAAANTASEGNSK